MKQRVQQLRNIFLGIILASGVLQVAMAAAPLDRIVAVVNNGVITQSQLNQQLATARQQLEQAHAPIPEAGKFRQQVLQHMIDTQLQLQAADKAGVKVSDAELSQAVSQIAQRNGLSVEQLQHELQQQG